jgi:hypothetical protein
MRSIWYPLLAIIIFSGLAACQAAGSGIPSTVNTDNTSGSVLALNITQPQDESIVRSNPVTVSGNVSGGAEVTINGLSVDAESGHFSAIVELETGPNSLEITANDAAGKQVSKYVSVVYVP